MASSNVGVEQWRHLFESILRWCSSIEALSGRTIEVLDVGGGWFPDDWHEDSDTHFARAVARVRELLPHVKQIISEPGKALAQPSIALAMRILEIQDFPGAATDVVVDGSIAELPMCFFSRTGFCTKTPKPARGNLRGAARRIFWAGFVWNTMSSPQMSACPKTPNPATCSFSATRALTTGV